MSIDASILEQLNKEQVLFSTDVLERVFVNDEVNIGFEDSYKIEAIVAILSASYKSEMIAKLFSSLAESLQIVIVQKMDLPTRVRLLHLLSDVSLMKPFFVALPDQDQKIFLDQLFKTDKAFYKQFIDFVHPNIDIVEGVIIDKPVLQMTDIIKDVSQLSDYLIQDNVSIDVCRQFSNHILGRYAKTDLDLFVDAFIDMMKDMSLSLKSKHHFFVYLKFFNVLLLFVSFNNQYHTYLNTFISRFLMDMSVIQDVVWHIKLFEQLPSYIVEVCVSHLAAFESISNQKQRNFYCKLLTSLKRHCAGDVDAEKLKQAFQSVQ